MLVTQCSEMVVRSCSDGTGYPFELQVSPSAGFGKHQFLPGSLLPYFSRLVCHAVIKSFFSIWMSSQPSSRPDPSASIESQFITGIFEVFPMRHQRFHIRIDLLHVETAKCYQIIGDMARQFAQSLSRKSMSPRAIRLGL